MKIYFQRGCQSRRSKQDRPKRPPPNLISHMRRLSLSWLRGEMEWYVGAFIEHIILPGEPIPTH